MIYFGSFFSGFINGLFASGAGQIFVFVLIFILKKETYKARATSILCMGITTLFSLIRFLDMVRVDFKNVIIIITTGMVFGVIGTKIMKKIPDGYLNLISGLLVTGFAIYGLVGG